MPTLHGQPIVLPGRILVPDDGASRGIALRPLPRRSPLAATRRQSHEQADAGRRRGH